MHHGINGPEVVPAGSMTNSRERLDASMTRDTAKAHTREELVARLHIRSQSGSTTEESLRKLAHSIATSDALAKKRAQHRQAGSGGGRAQGPGDNACFCTLRAQETLSRNGKRSDGQKLRTGLACAPAPERNLTDRILARAITDLDEIALAVSAPGQVAAISPARQRITQLSQSQPDSLLSLRTPVAALRGCTHRESCAS